MSKVLIDKLRPVLEQMVRRSSHTGACHRGDLISLVWSSMRSLTYTLGSCPNSVCIDQTQSGVQCTFQPVLAGHLSINMGAINKRQKNIMNVPRG